MFEQLLEYGFSEHTYYRDDYEETFARLRVEGEQDLADLISFFGELVDEDIYPLNTLYFLIEASEDMETVRYLFIEKKVGGVTVAQEEISSEVFLEYLEEYFQYSID